MAAQIGELDNRRAQLVRERDTLIRQLLRAGATSKALQGITGLPRSQIVNIRKA